MANLTLIYRRIELTPVIIVALIFLFSFFRLTSGGVPERLWIFFVVSVAIMGILLLGYFWVDYVEIDKNKGIAIVRSQNTFKQNEEIINIRSTQFVSIGLEIAPSKNTYIIGLMRESESKQNWIFKVGGMDKAWKSVVQIADYLDISVCDKISESAFIWDKGKVPQSLSERSACIRKHT